jgi:cysteine desulfurase / selenocysteine lyase
LIDIDRIRADTPAVARLAYLHNAGAALMPTPVVAAMKQHIDLESEIGGYAAADRESDRLDAVYGSVARLLNAAPDEIAWRTRPSPGRWRSTHCRFAPATES